MKFVFHMVAAGLVGLLLCSCFGVPGIRKYYAGPVAGRVIDFKTGKGIAGAEIILSPQSYAYCSKPPSPLPELTCYTDRNGFFMFQELGFTPTCSFSFPFTIIDFPESGYSLIKYKLDIYANEYRSASATSYPIEIPELDIPYESTLFINPSDFFIDNGFVVIMLYPKDYKPIEDKKNKNGIVVAL